MIFHTFYNSGYPFQFHKGTIRTLLLRNGRRLHLDFNSIKVQLEQALPELLLCQYTYFNSIKVQLEQIASIGAYLNLTNFNSIKVQLELPPGVGG